MSDKIRLGFVGCGGIAEAHMKALFKNPSAEIVGFCDINLKRAEEVSKQYGAAGARIFDETKVMLRKVRPDAVFFCLPPFAHGAELAAVRRNVPFFVEKPVNLYLDQARKIARASEKKNLLTSVGYMNRYRKGVNRVREILKEDPPILVLGGWIGKTPQPRPGGGIWTWWIKKDKSGGQFHEQVTHTVDLVRFMCGEISEIQAYSTRNLNKTVPAGFDIEDASAVNLRLVNGAVGNLWASCAADGGGGGVSLNVYANQSTALLTGWEHNLRLFKKGAEPEEIAGEPEIFSVEDSAFIEAVRKNDPSQVMCSYSDGVKTIKVTLAANESMTKGRPVKIHN